MSAKPDYVVSKLTRPVGGAATGGFVINLTSSTTPMALSQPKDPTLAQFSFFVSRRLEDGRERFRLHMGYFETMQAAEEMLVVVRDVYPGAWASEAPGKKLRGSKPQAAAAPPPARPVAATPAPAPARAVAPPPAPESVAPPAAAAPMPHPFDATPPPAVLKYETEEPFVLVDEPEFKPANIPVVQPPAKPVASPPASAASKPAAKLAAARAAAKPAPKPAPVAAKPAAPKAAAPKPAVPAKPPMAAKPAVAPKPAIAAKPAAAPAPKPVVASPPPAAARPVVPAKPPMVAPKIAAKVSAPALQAAAPAPKARPPEPTVQMPAIKPPISATPSLTNMRQVIEELDDLSDTQTIRLLERHSPYREGSQEASVDEAIRVIKPEDAMSMQAIKNEVKRNAPVLFAVQLDWSVSSFDMAKVPPLAIFNAYTLYTTEANRDGRTWYGLRLGFFSDAVSAKQVAYYVRSDFKSVSVVPVTTIEKERANDINAARSGIHRAVNIKEGPAPTPLSMTSSNASGVFKLLDDDLPEMIEQDVDGETSPRFGKQASPALAPTAKAASAAAAPAAPPAPQSKASKGRKPGARGVRRDAHAQVDEETLDQTLEILGANSLEITNDSAENTGVRHLRVKVDKKGSKFASLIDRLSGKK